MLVGSHLEHPARGWAHQRLSGELIFVALSDSALETDGGSLAGDRHHLTSTQYCCVTPADTSRDERSRVSFYTFDIAILTIPYL